MINTKEKLEALIINMVSGARELFRVEEGLPGNKKNFLTGESAPHIPSFLPKLCRLFGDFSAGS